MARPTYQVQVGFTVGGVGAGAVIGVAKIDQAVVAEAGSDTEAAVTWTTLTGVIDVHISRGRQDALAKMEPGSCSVICHNQSGDFSPEYTSSPYYPNVKPMKRLRVQMTWDGTTYGRFYGLIRGWHLYQESGQHYVSIQCVALSLQLIKQQLNTTPAQQLTGARIGAVLDLVPLLGLGLFSWPTSLRDLDAGQLTVPAVALANQAGLAHADDLMDVEDGRFWIAGDGKATFRDRYARYTNTVSTVPRRTFVGAAGLPFREPAYDFNADALIN